MRGLVALSAVLAMGGAGAMPALAAPAVIAGAQDEVAVLAAQIQSAILQA